MAILIERFLLQMIWAEVNAIGCSVTFCKQLARQTNVYAFACVYQLACQQYLIIIMFFINLLLTYQCQDRTVSEATKIYVYARKKNFDSSNLVH